ncbi:MULTISPECIES: ABC transporter ATP-binding protein [unclassified Streptomyces]|uniref:ABC transporter ATP-binding protein n=1 Tax=unclassified Streptomyces TaxID=2593676 RepID=UPI001BE73B78|nr:MULTISPECIES: ABC transporter ATP-binding protein [unclassified Streptomyces]MBT2406564.1 ABC transporter ATP-binding protein [Streptomyces sp. ISL-21]MBT2458032.1 ABC transporter ATP-binding protein [Streptomyces sp. ISL-86]MBT2608902.1 ABC transporter ATP-binding protein [Streptomyces sp. ISL-87]
MSGRSRSADGHALPVAARARLVSAACGLIRQDRYAFAAMLALNTLAVAAGLAGPWLLGRIVNEVQAGATVSTVDRLAVGVLISAVAQLLLARWARLVGYRFGERTLARVRERFVDRALALPVSVVERAGTGDLTVRGTSDVGAVGTAVRDAGPDLFIAGIQAPLILAAVFLLDPLLGVCGLAGLVGIWFATRWYLRRAHAAYLAEGAGNSALAEQLSVTASGARTIEAFGLEERHIAASLKRIEHSHRTRMRTLSLRSVLFPSVDTSHVLPVVGALLVGALLLERGMVTLGAVVAAVLYLRQLAEPLDMILQWVEQLQSSGASFARVEGLGVALDSGAGAAPAAGPSARPGGDRIELSGVHYSYDGKSDVVRGVDLTVRPGERLAVVGRSGAGKSTLSRLLAGIDTPSAGTVSVGGVPVSDLPPQTLRRQVVLVTQEHHVFFGTLRDNLLLAAPDATDAELTRALTAVGADWAERLPRGLDAELGARGHQLDGSQAQQLSLARVVLADPHTLILDEATALLDPRTARRTERALAAVLKGRTVIAIAHRLHTAHDADRVAVMDGGRLTELGSHEELVAAGGTYAALWRSWHGDGGADNPGAEAAGAAGA